MTATTAPRGDDTCCTIIIIVIVIVIITAIKTKKQVPAAAAAVEYLGPLRTFSPFFFRRYFVLLRSCVMHDVFSSSDGKLDKSLRTTGTRVVGRQVLRRGPFPSFYRSRRSSAAFGIVRFHRLAATVWKCRRRRFRRRFRR